MRVVTPIAEARPMRLLPLLPLVAALALSPAGPQSGSARAQDGAEAQVLTAPGLALPGSFTGTIPMASGPGAEWHLDLWPDQVFHLRQDYPDQTAADIGRWHADPARRAIVLRGGREAPVFLEVRGNGDLRLMTPEGEAIESDLPYTLAASPLDPAEVSLPMTGVFRYMADAATFSICLTGRSYPVAMEGAYIDAERAYLAIEDRDPGEAVLAVLEGTLAMRPAMEGPDRTHLVIDRFSRFAPGDTCDRSRADAALTDTYWRLLEIGGDEIAPMEGHREPYLILHSPEGDTSTAFNATVGCNMMRGGYERGVGDALSFGQAAMTMMACPPPLDARERALTEALGQVAGLQITGTTLELFDVGGTRVLMAEAVYLP
jgi:copper homeostasis protein (lipoprotein)